MVRKIRLDCTLEFGSRANFAIIDVTDGPEKKRGTITIDYAPSDIEQLKARGMDLDKALEYYENHIYELVKYYISGDWEPADATDMSVQSDATVGSVQSNATSTSPLKISDATSASPLKISDATSASPLKIIEAHIGPQFE